MTQFRYQYLVNAVQRVHDGLRLVLSTFFSLEGSAGRQLISADFIYLIRNWAVTPARAAFPTPKSIRIDHPRPREGLFESPSILEFPMALPKAFPAATGFVLAFAIQETGQETAD